MLTSFAQNSSTKLTEGGATSVTQNGDDIWNGPLSQTSNFFYGTSLGRRSSSLRKRLPSSFMQPDAADTDDPDVGNPMDNPYPNATDGGGGG